MFGYPMQILRRSCRRRDDANHSSFASSSLAVSSSSSSSLFAADGGVGAGLLTPAFLVRLECDCRDRATGASRGFGFVTFSDPASVDKVLSQDCTWEGRKLDCKIAVPRDSGAGGVPIQRIRKIFVGGLTSTLTAEDLKEHFGQFGTVVNAIVMLDPVTQRSRGFGFVTFDTEEAVDSVLARTHTLGGKQIECKKAVSKQKINSERVSSLPAQDARASGYPAYPAYAAAAYAHPYYRDYAYPAEYYGGYGAGSGYAAYAAYGARAAANSPPRRSSGSAGRAGQPSVPVSRDRYDASASRSGGDRGDRRASSNAGGGDRGRERSYHPYGR